MLASSRAIVQNALSSFREAPKGFNVKTFVLKATNDIWRLLRGLPETGPWMDPAKAATSYVVVIEVTMGKETREDLLLN